jgi:hypothetical protein
MDTTTQFARNWRKIGVVFLRLGATAYAGPGATNRDDIYRGNARRSTDSS